jgi:hypothetical protein
VTLTAVAAVVTALAGLIRAIAYAWDVKCRGAGRPPTTGVDGRNRS